MQLQYLAAVFVPRPTEHESVAQDLFFGGSGRRAVAHTRPAFPKNAYGPVGNPLIRGASGAVRSTQPPEGCNSLGGRPPEAVGKIQLPKHTRPDPRRSQHCRPKCDLTTECSSYKKLRYLFHAPLNVKVWHKAFFFLY